MAFSRYLKWINDNPLVRRILINILLFSSIFTIFATGIQLYFDYSQGVDQVHDRIKAIQESDLKALARSIWEVDKEQITIQLNGIFRLPDIQYVELVDRTKNLSIILGEKVEENAISQQFPLTFNYKNKKNIWLGTLTIMATKEFIFQRIREKVIVILFTQLFKTFFVSMFIFFILYYMVSRHLTSISHYTRLLNFNQLDTPLDLNRRLSKNHKFDALDRIVTSINDMRIGLLSEIKDRKAAEKSVIESERQLKDGEKIAHMGSWSMNLATGKSAWSDEFFRICGYEPQSFEPLTKKGFEIIHPEDRDRVTQIVEHSVKVRKPYSIETRIILPDGTIRWIHSSGNVLLGDNAEPERISGSFLDITDRKLAEEQVKANLKEKETLLQEIHHRVKNNMQVISSLLKLQSNSYDDERIKKPLLESQNRVKAMAAVHENLYKSKNLSSISILPFLKELTTSILASYQLSSENITLEIDSDEIFINLEQASPLGLIVNELVSNSLKHAFTDGHKGEIHINLKRVNEDHIHLCFSDDGIGLPVSLDWRNLDSLGLKLVLNLAENQLDGSIKMEVKNGTQFDIIFRED
ncbi:MAG: PAS domain-containing protein [Deltaproteobacteria bacterium]|nr:PAS domain-containing protein [Deltaproteobacteria bacterium]